MKLRPPLAGLLQRLRTGFRWSSAKHSKTKRLQGWSTRGAARENELKHRSFGELVSVACKATAGLTEKRLEARVASLSLHCMGDSVLWPILHSGPGRSHWHVVYLCWAEWHEVLSHPNKKDWPANRAQSKLETTSRQARCTSCIVSANNTTTTKTMCSDAPFFSGMDQNVTHFYKSRRVNVAADPPLEMHLSGVVTPSPATENGPYFQKAGDGATRP